MAQPAVAFLVPGDINTRTGGYAYDRAIIAGLRLLGWQVDVHSLAAGFPFPTPAALASTAALLASFPDDRLVVIDGLAFGAMPEIAEAEGKRLRLVSLVHHPLALETGLDAAQAAALKHSETRALATTRAVIVTSAATGETLGAFGVARGHVTVVEPGTDHAAVAKGSGSPRLALLCVASLTPRKGHDVLFAALAGLASYDWSLTCVGGSLGDERAFNRLQTQVAALGLKDRIHFAGERDGALLDVAYGEADLFVLPTWYEGYGMVVAEALARALPVISTRTGAIPDLVGEQAGIVVAPGDATALYAALLAVLEKPDVLPALKAGALAARDRLPRWDLSCGRLASVLHRVAHS